MSIALFSSKKKISGKSSDRNNTYWEYTFQAPSILKADTSDVIEFPLSSFFTLERFKIVCGSLDFSVSIRTKKDLSLPSLYEVLTYDNLNLKNPNNVAVNEYMINSDYPETSNLYMVITNTDAVNHTGVIWFQFLISQG